MSFFFAGSDSRPIVPNDGYERSPSGRRVAGTRALLLAGTGVGLAILAAGCGGGKAAPSVASLATTPTTTTSSAGNSGVAAPSLASGTSASGRSGGQFALVGGGSAEQLTRYSACMRKNGVPSFPDPNAQGQISFSSAGGVDPGSAGFQQAQQACQKLLPHGGQPSPAHQAQARAAALAFSACMRSHGEPNFPDPQFGSGGTVRLSIGQGAGIDPRSPQFQTAQKSCLKVRPGLPIAAPLGGAGPKTAGGGTTGG